MAKTLIAAAFSGVKFVRCVGIEILPDLCEAARGVIQRTKNMIGDVSKGKIYVFFTGMFFCCDVHIVHAGPRNADIVSLTNNFPLLEIWYGIMSRLVKFTYIHVCVTLALWLLFVFIDMIGREMQVMTLLWECQVGQMRTSCTHLRYVSRTVSFKLVRCLYMQMIDLIILFAIYLYVCRDLEIVRYWARS